MKIKNLRKSDDAVVGIIVTVLLIGLILVVISMIQTVFIPNWMEQIEADHMDEISGQFGQLKFAIDIQSVLGISDVPVSVPITLGSNNIPFLTSVRSYGSIEILQNQMEVYIENATYYKTYNLGTIKHSSTNTYYLNQDHIYESGAQIVSQAEGSAMTVKPLINIENSSGIINMNITLVNIIDVGNKAFASGYGNFPIKIEYNPPKVEDQYNDTTIIFFNTSYVDAWYSAIVSILRVNEIEHYYDLEKTAEYIKIEKDPLVPHTLNVDITEITIKAQIAPGWIED